MKATLTVLVTVLLLGGAGAPAAARSLRDNLPDAARKVGIEGGSAFDALADAIANSASRSLPIISASAGFTYQYNPTLEVFERTSETLGPIFMLRPDTIGRGKFNVNVSWQYVELDEYDGTPANRLQSDDLIVVDTRDASGALVRRSANELRYNLHLITNVVAFSLTYGILDNLDVNLLIPLLETDFDATANRQRVSVADPGGGFVPQPGRPLTGVAGGDHFGVGDIFLRAKYQLARLGWLRSAAGLQLRLPSGKEEDFQGTGSTEISPFFTASTVLWGRVEPIVDLGIDYRVNDVSRSQGRYDIGVDVDITKRIALALAFLGRSEFEGTATRSETSFLHLTPTGLQSEPLLGLDFGRKDYFDFSFGARAVVWRQIMFFANGIYALNDEGFRSSTIIPTVGIEGTF